MIRPETRVHGQSGKRGRRFGFTIVEMIVVMVIMALMAAVAIPAFKNWVEEDDMTTATQTIEALFRLARDSAVRSGGNVTVWIDSASSGVWLVAAVDSMSAQAANAGEPEVTGKIGPSPGEPLGLPTTVELLLPKTRARFAFAPSGAVFADTLELRTIMGNRFITLNTWTGDVIY
jgi:prepilin-type N-terminal cleavage/methylation domain-containing protein